MQIATGTAVASCLPSLLRSQAPAADPYLFRLRSPRYDQVALLGGIPLAQQQNAQVIL